MKLPCLHNMVQFENRELSICIFILVFYFLTEDFKQQTRFLAPTCISTALIISQI